MQDPISLSALQHYDFCPRQCAYIHIERLWQDNYLTAKGNQLHERVHSTESEKRGDVKTERGVQVHSEQYGITGKLDLLEIKQKPYTLIPVEYKRGKPKIEDCDRIQLCAQALCLEEMRDVIISRAAIWYWQVRKREWIELDTAIRDKTIHTIQAVSELFDKKQLPKAEYTNSCKACSFFDICQPRNKDHSLTYVKELFNDEEVIK